MSKHSKCWEHGKIMFDTERAAYEYASFLKRRHGWYMRVYWDDACDCYHLTSQL